MADEKPLKIGSGITAFTRPVSNGESKQDRAANFVAFNKFVERPFDRYLPWVRGAEKKLLEYRQKVGEAHIFREHDEPGWYCEEIVYHNSQARRCAEGGNLQWAMFHAARLGSLTVEAELKFKWEKEALAGQKSIAGGASTRRGDQDRRVAEVDTLAAQIGRGGKRAAFAIVAEREGVTPKAIETDYYKARKKSLS